MSLNDGIFYGLDRGLIQGLGDRVGVNPGDFADDGEGGGGGGGGGVAFDKAAALRAMGVDGSIPGVGAFYGLNDGLLEGLGER